MHSPQCSLHVGIIYLVNSHAVYICVPGCCQKQSQETCDALNVLTSGRSVEKAGETCEINDDCTQFTCTGVVDPNNNPPVVAESVYTFDPCDDPISFSAVGTVNTLPDPVLDVVVNESSSINFNPDFLGTIHIFLEPTMGGVMLEVSGMRTSMCPYVHVCSCKLKAGSMAFLAVLYITV